jgi:hypothetical protein
MQETITSAAAAAANARTCTASRSVMLPSSKTGAMYAFEAKQRECVPHHAVEAAQMCTCTASRSVMPSPIMMMVL